ncbi:MAG: rhodanese-like domain-containing protein [Paraclostridium sp.]|uniref:rhodanese-like domain-containing protein n=1 Tax=Paraclostridium sp. TaxID=2023273 RepID=UPI003F305451
MKKNKKIKAVVLGLLLTFSIGTLVGCSQDKGSEDSSKSTKNYKNINAKETEDLIASGDDIAVVDVRTKDEYDTGHIDRAMNIDFDDFQNNLTILDDYKEKPVLLYCKTGNRSEKAAKILKDNGFTEVYNATDGVEEHDYKLVK